MSSNKTSGVRTRTGDLRIMRPPLELTKVKSVKPLRLPTSPIAHHLPTDTRKSNPDLAAVVDAWPTLPEAVKAGIVAMVKASGGKGGR
jgi:hypothetical protein